MASPDRPPLPGAEALYEHAACGLLLTDRDGTIRRVNQTFCDWVGMERADLLERCRFQDLLTMGGRIFHQTHWAPLLQMQGSVAEVKIDLTHRDGHPVPALLNAVGRDYGGVMFHELAVVAAHDRHAYERELVRTRQRAEQLAQQQGHAQQALALADAQLRLALETADLHVWEVDPATGHRTYAPSVALLLGMDRPQAVTAEQYLGAIDPRDLPAAQAAFSQVMQSSAEVYRSTYRIHGIDGMQRTVRATARALVGDSGRVERITGLIQDITDLSRQRAVAEDRALFAEQMMGIVSHDLRNPLQTILLGSELLEGVCREPRQKTTAGHVKRAAGRAQRMIGDLLDFTMARIGSGLSLAVRSVDVHAVIAEQVNELSLAYPGVLLRHVAEGEGMCQVDADRLCQLVGNLVANATSYGTPGTAVTVTSAVGPENVRISVHNTGPVIPPELLPALFKPMVRGVESTDGLRSVGLGLYIVNEIVIAHHGRMQVTSSAAEGTTFTAILPRQPPEVNPA